MRQIMTSCEKRCLSLSVVFVMSQVRGAAEDTAPCLSLSHELQINLIEIQLMNARLFHTHFILVSVSSERTSRCSLMRLAFLLTLHSLSVDLYPK